MWKSTVSAINFINEIAAKGKKMGLKINEEKPKMMRLNNQYKKGGNKLGGYTFKEVDKFKYLDVMLTSNG